MTHLALVRPAPPICDWSVAYRDAANDGVAARLGLPFRLEFRSGPKPQSVNPLQASGVLLRSFVVWKAPAKSAGGVIELLAEPVFAGGPAGELGHARLVAFDGVALQEGSIGTKRGWFVVKELSLQDGQVFALRSLRIRNDEGKAV